MQKSLVGKLEIGTRVVLTNEKFNGVKATVKYVGPLDSTIEWIGVELDEEKGSHSGQYKGKSYFTCKANHGAFVKSNCANLLDGTPLDELHSQSAEIKKEPLAKKDATKGQPTKNPPKPEPKETKDPTGPAKKPAPPAVPGKPPARTTVVTKKPEEREKEKLANELEGAMNAQITTLKDQLKEAQDEIRDLKQNTNYNEIVKLREHVSQLETERRQLNLAKELISNKVETEREQKAKDLVDEINFYKNEKEKAEKDKKRMETRLKALQASLQEEAGKEELISKMTLKSESLEAKCESMRIELENAKTELKNSKVAAGKGDDQQPQDKDVKDYLIEIETLNETVVLLESELNEEKPKREALEKELEGVSDKLKEFTKMEKLLKRKEADIVELKEALEQNSDAVTFAEQLSIRKLKVEEELQQAKSKINELLADKDIMEQVQQSQEQISHELEHEINERDNEIDRLLQKIKDKENEITDHLKQNAKLKEKVIALLKQVESNVNLRKIESEQQQLRESTALNTTVGGYNNIQYLEIMKHCEQVNQKYLRLQNEFSQVKNKVGVYVLNILEALPDDFSHKLYPEGIDLIIAIKTARDKLYYLFETISTQLRERNQLYSDENTELANWMLMLMGRIEKASHNLFRLELLLGVCETEEQLANIVTRRTIKQQANFMENFSSECLAKFVDNSVSVAITFEQFDQSLKVLEEQNNLITGTLAIENEMKLRMSSESMSSILYTLEMVLNFKLLSELKENAPIDSTLENHLKKMGEYLREVCLNSHIRYRPHMQNYLEGLKVISEMFKDIEAENLILHFENLNVEREEIKILKNVLLTMQTYIKELQIDLEDIQFSDELKKLQTRLTGGMWRKRIDLIRDELMRVRQLTDQKNDLEIELVEAKKKILIQEKDLKDKIVVKEVLEKRIGELQLRVEQISGLEAEIKRLTDKLRNSEEGNKAMEEEIDSLLAKRNHMEDEIKKLKEKLEVQVAQGQLKQAARASVVHTMSLDSVPVKNILKENSALRNVHLKERIVKLRYSPILQIGAAPTSDPYKKLRKQTLASLVDTKIYTPGDNVETGRSDQLLLSIQNIAKEVQQASTTKLVQVGTIRVDVGCNPTSFKLDRLLYGRAKALLSDHVAQN